MTNNDTPMMRQYRKIKAELPDGVILFFRLGDFYEMFFDDAKIAAGILNIALTKRNNIPMCGLPFHALDQYLAKIIRAGKKVALCDQVEDPSQAKGIVRREVTRIVTPGTVIEDDILDSSAHNYLAGVSRMNGAYGLALLDLSTGQFIAERKDTVDALADAIARLCPSECVAPEAFMDSDDGLTLKRAIPGIELSVSEDWTFDYQTAFDDLTRHFKVRSLEGFGCQDEDAVVCAAGGVLHYVKEDLRHQVAHVRGLRLRVGSDFMLIDDTTCRNLDLLPTRGRTASACLLRVLDVTRTAMGARLLRDWMLRPLASYQGVLERQNAVTTFRDDRILLAEMRELLSTVRDMERIITRIGSGNGNARDLQALGQSLLMLPTLRQLLSTVTEPGLQSQANRIEELPELAGLIECAIVDEPPTTIKEGGIIRDGYNAELDVFRHAASEGRSWLAEYQASEQERTGIKTLKVRHNKVFGYYLEISKGQLANVPPEYVRKQTLVNAERFITPELKEYENKVFGAHEKAVALEHELFLAIRNQTVSHTASIQLSAEAVAQLDVLSTLADRSMALNYTRPTISETDRLVITGGRHPVIEQMDNAERFVPNDTLLDGTENQLAIITGPNMAGKSTYIRQVGVIVIMAQMGSYVPAEAAEVGLVDRVFTRVGASDDLARGRSTFMVEMEETANILNNATPRSLIILDEIGRGTSTFDGISIAWAVAEYLHENQAVKAKTLFATHYHELTDLTLTMPGVRNYNVLAKEQGKRVVFLRKIVPGGADKSYGIQVARLAGLPESVIERASEILVNLEEGEMSESGQPTIAKRRKRKGKHNPDQLSLFGE